MLLVQILFNLLLFVLWPLHFLYHEFFISKKKKERRDLSLLIAQIDHRLTWDRDILTPTQTRKLQAVKDASQNRLTSDADAGTGEFIADAVGKIHQAAPAGSFAAGREWLELLVVVFGVVMGARALILQPFKIPTGSMQPSMNGINFVATESAAHVGRLQRIFDYVNYSHRYVDVTVKSDGTLRLSDYLGANAGQKARSPIVGRNPFFFFPNTKITIGGQTYTFPGEPDKVLQYLQLYRFDSQVDADGDRQWMFRNGQVLARGYLELGDHLFVDRVSLNFTEPRRGDITVFVTDGITTQDGNPLRGRYYIKRLVGLPGDELKIVDHQLYVRQPEQSSFTLVDGSFHPAFDRIYSHRGGYRGYSHPPQSSCQYLRSNDETFAVGADEYFMLGDNSENSQDSRFWGTVPRSNIVGRALYVYWPFSRRWGHPDRAEPQDFSSPPTQPVR